MLCLSGGTYGTHILRDMPTFQLLLELNIDEVQGADRCLECLAGLQPLFILLQLRQSQTKVTRLKKTHMLQGRKNRAVFDIPGCWDSVADQAEAPKISDPLSSSCALLLLPSSHPLLSVAPF